MCGASRLGAALPEEYAVADITGWTPAQLEALPYFDRYVPDAASGDYVPIARSGFGMTAGNRSFSSGTWVQGSGAFLREGAVTSIPAWLRSGYGWSYSWSRTWWDGEDVHFQNGFVTHSPVRDINAFGQIVGYATVPGSGDSSTGYSDHAFLHDALSGSHTDLTPTATRADPRAINDLGEIVGNWSNATESHAFRRSAAGTFIDFVLASPIAHGMTPKLVNNRGQAAGDAIVYSTPLRDQRPFFSESGGAVVQLPLPSQNSPDVGTVADMNEHGVIVGEAHKAASFNETSGVRWAKSGSSWQAEDLNELLSDHEPQIIVDRALAINDAGHILVSGHLDGSDTPNTRKFLLSPDAGSKPAVSTLTPLVGVTTATLRAKINAAGSATQYRFVHDLAAGDGAGNTSGTAPLLAGLEVSGLAPNTTYSYHATATNDAGTTIGVLQTFTTKWDWPSWSAAQGRGAHDEDANGNGLPDLVDFAAGEDFAQGIAVEGGLLKLTYRRALNVVGVRLNVQVSDDLLEWEDAVATETTSVPDGGDGEIVTVCVDATPGRRFTRLHASIP